MFGFILDDVIVLFHQEAAENESKNEGELILNRCFPEWLSPETLWLHEQHPKTIDHLEDLVQLESCVFQLITDENKLFTTYYLTKQDST